MLECGCLRVRVDLRSCFCTTYCLLDLLTVSSMAAAGNNMTGAQAIAAMAAVMNQVSETSQWHSWSNLD